jgi:hypothetical protein
MKPITLRDLMQLVNSLDIEIWVIDEHVQRVVPSKAHESMRCGETIIVIEPQSWVERGGDVY